jgi:hypothetical protein
LDYTGFPRAYLLDLHDVARHRCHLMFNWGHVISQVRSIAYSLLVNCALRDSARRRVFFLRKAVARRGHLQLTANFDREIETESGCRFFVCRSRGNDVNIGYTIDSRAPFGRTLRHVTETPGKVTTALLFQYITELGWP